MRYGLGGIDAQTATSTFAPMDHIASVKQSPAGAVIQNGCELASDTSDLAHRLELLADKIVGTEPQGESTSEKEPFIASFIGELQRAHQLQRYANERIAAAVLRLERAFS